MENGKMKNIPIISSITKFFKEFHKRFVNGSIGTKISHFILGAGNFCHKQYVKGAVYLLLQIAFIFFMFSGQVVINNTHFGLNALIKLKTLGTDAGGELIFDSNGVVIGFTEAENSMLILLFGVITIGIILIYLFLWLSAIKSSYKADMDVLDGKKPTTIVEDLKSLFDERFHLLMLTPTCLAALIFTVLPTIYMILIAFTNYDRFHIPPSQLFTWTRFDNFAAIFTGSNEISERFLPVLGWTFTWALVATVTNYFGGILLALLINKKEIKLKKLWRTVFIMTIALPQFVSLLAVKNLLNGMGPINSMLMDLNIISEPIAFLGAKAGQSIASSADVTRARITILVINLWIGVPYTMLQTSGILMNIPSDLYEAATIDGANKNQMFFNITLPYIFFVTTPYLISSFVGNINSFNVIFLLTGGGPKVGLFEAGGTDLLVTWLYKLTIEQYDYNLGAVIGIFTFIITSTITLITYRRSKAYNEEDTFQ